MTDIIKTSARLAYRNLGPADVPALHAIMSDWAVVQQLGSWPWPADPAFTRSRCQPFVGDGFIWAITHQNTLIGTVGVTDGTLGYCLKQTAWGQGFGTESAQTALDHHFQSPNAPDVIAAIWADNAPSIGLIQKLGFTYTHTITEFALARGVEMPDDHYVMPRMQWLRLRTAAQ